MNVLENQQVLFNKIRSQLYIPKEVFDILSNTIPDTLLAEEYEPRIKNTIKQNAIGGGDYIQSIRRLHKVKDKKVIQSIQKIIKKYQIHVSGIALNHEFEHIKVWSQYLVE